VPLLVGGALVQYLFDFYPERNLTALSANFEMLVIAVTLGGLIWAAVRLSMTARK
jgi:hypothetical protein